MPYRIIRRAQGDTSHVRDGNNEIMQFETRDQAQTMADMMNRSEKIGGARYVYSVIKVREGADHG
jgi:hypothetical protein